MYNERFHSEVIRLIEIAKTKESLNEDDIILKLLKYKIPICV